MQRDAVASGKGDNAAGAHWGATRRDRHVWARAASTLDGVLSGYGYDVIGGTALYRLVATADAGALHHGLAVRGILTRIFAGMPDRLRIGAPGAAAGFERLAAALGEIVLRSVCQMTSGLTETEESECGFPV